MVPAKLLFVVLAVSVFIGAEALECGPDVEHKHECSGGGKVCKYAKDNVGDWTPVKGEIMWTGEIYTCEEPAEKKYINQCVKLPTENVYYCDTDLCNTSDKCKIWKDPKDIAEPEAPTPTHTSTPAPKSSGDLVQPIFLLLALLFVLY